MKIFKVYLEKQQCCKCDGYYYGLMVSSSNDRVKKCYFCYMADITKPQQLRIEMEEGYEMQIPD